MQLEHFASSDLERQLQRDVDGKIKAELIKQLSSLQDKLNRRLSHGMAKADFERWSGANQAVNAALDTLIAPFK